MIIDHLIRNFPYNGATDSRPKANRDRDPENVSLSRTDKGNFNELHTPRCTLMQNKYNCKLPVVEVVVLVVVVVVVVGVASRYTAKCVCVEGKASSVMPPRKTT